MLSKEEVQHIAKLARLGLTDRELEKYPKELSKILDYFEKLKEVKVSGVEPMSHSVLVENVTRTDIHDTRYKIHDARLLEQAPETKNGYLKTKPILK